MTGKPTKPWIDFNGNGLPRSIKPQDNVEVMYRNGSTSAGPAESLEWRRSFFTKRPIDIIRYRIVPSVDEDGEPVTMMTVEFIDGSTPWVDYAGHEEALAHLDNGMMAQVQMRGGPYAIGMLMEFNWRWDADPSNDANIVRFRLLENDE